MRKKCFCRMSLVLSTVMLISGCGTSTNSGSPDPTDSVLSEQTKLSKSSDGKSEAPVDSLTFYQPTFKSSGTDADLYNKNMEHFQEQFLAYFKENNELEKVTGYDQPIKVSTTNWYTAAMEEAAKKFNGKYGESLSENRFTDALKRLYNIDVTYSWQSQDADYIQKLRLDMAAGQLPDIFLVREQSDLIQMAEQGLIWDMTDIVEQYASNYDKEVWKSDDGAAITRATIDDRLYGIPSMQSATDSVSYIFIRDDWMKKLNLEYPKTLDELSGVMDAFVNQDPDGNGQKDTWGLSMNNTIFTSTRGICAAYGSYPEDWYEQDGKLVYGGTSDSTKEALGYIAGLYEKGYINPEFVVHDAAKAKELVLNNQVGIVFGGHWFGHDAGDLHELNPDSSWKCIPLPTVDGTPVRSILRPTMQGWVVVNKNFGHPEIALKMRAATTYALLCEESAWWWYDENIAWNFSPVRCNVSAYDNLNTYINLKEGFKANDESLLRAKAVPYWSNLHGEQAWEWNLMFGPGEGTAFSVLEMDKNAGNLFWNLYNGVQSSFMQERWSSIKTESTRFFTDIITGKVSVDEGYSQWLDTYQNLGGSQIEEEVNTWYTESK